VERGRRSTDMKRQEKILRLCVEIEVLCDSNYIDNANNKILELLGEVALRSKYKTDVDHAAHIFLNKSLNYQMKRI
jgi:hypothetical protein